MLHGKFILLELQQEKIAEKQWKEKIPQKK